MNIKKRIVALLVSLCMVATIGLVGCGGGAQQLSGTVTGSVGTMYKTKWFDFKINSMTTGTSYEGYTAANGNRLVIINVTITNTFDTPQEYGTFDWFVSDGNLDNAIWPIDPLNNNMMPLSTTLSKGQTITCDVVVEYPENMPTPYFMYVEIDVSGTISSTFKLPIK